MLDRLEQHQLFLKFSKCTFTATQVEYLGHIISAQGVQMDPSKIDSITRWPYPTIVKEVRAFLGLTGYYRRFVQHYGIIAQPLTTLLKKNAFHWTNEAKQAWDELKKPMITAPVLILPDFNEVFMIEADASSKGIGAVLSQKKKPVAFFSKVLSSTQQALFVYEKEMMAILIAVKKWSSYLLGKHFLIMTNHKSLQFFLHQEAWTPAQQKWAIKMMGFDYEIIYRKGSSNAAADALSR